MALLIALARWHTYGEPMDRDLGDYASVAHEMRCGKELYSEVSDQKPPAIHLTYYFAEWIAGYGRREIYLMTVAASWLTLFASYAACVGLTGNRKAALWTAAFWTIVSGHLQLEANQPNAEVFMNAFCMSGLALLACDYASGPAGRKRWRTVLLAGACFTWATLYKQVAVLIPMSLTAAYLVFPPPGTSRWKALSEGALIGAVIVAGWGATASYFAVNGRFGAFYHWVFAYNVGYAGSLTDNISDSFQPEYFFPYSITQALLPLAALALLGIGAGFFTRRIPQSLSILFLGVGSHIAVALPGNWFPHYYQLWFPWLLAGAGCGMDTIERVFRSKQTAVAGGAIVLLALLGMELPNYWFSPEEWSRKKYKEVFVESNKVASYLNSHLIGDETFFQFGDDAELYPLTGRRPPTPVLGAYDFFLQPGNPSERLIEALTVAPPEMVVFDGGSDFAVDTVHNGAILRFIANRYQLVYRQGPTFQIMELKGGAFECRARRAATVGR